MLLRKALAFAKVAPCSAAAISRCCARDLAGKGDLHFLNLWLRADGQHIGPLHFVLLRPDLRPLHPFARDAFRTLEQTIVNVLGAHRFSLAPLSITEP